MANKFEVDDRVTNVVSGDVGTVVEVEPDRYSFEDPIYHVVWDRAAEHAREHGHKVLATPVRNHHETIQKIGQVRPHGMVRPEKLTGGHADRICVECGLQDDNPVHGS